MGKVQYLLALTPEQKEKLRELAKARRWSMNTWLVDAIEQAYGKEALEKTFGFPDHSDVGSGITDVGEQV